MDDFLLNSTFNTGNLTQKEMILSKNNTSLHYGILKKKQKAQ